MDGPETDELTPGILDAARQRTVTPTRFRSRPATPGRVYTRGMLRRPFSRAAASALLLTLAAVLAGCSRTTDTFTPHISVTSDGNASREQSFLIQGYVLDDVGVTQVAVDGKPIPIQPGSDKLARFQFRTMLSTPTGKYTITARDAAGNEGKLVLPVSVDPVRPVIRVTRFERSGGVVRVAGTVTDNNRVAQILVDGNRLNITPGNSVDFYAETTGIWADIEAADAAGNRTTLRAR
ncbi:hypothetical protein GCM10008961_03330 [Deinococcus knuensis]|uniref:Bacterial Ig domain-containing protein n=2 Tax=Deinococcus knuensis TaxID=1837380 RepID=A0ABQ2SDY6_9DEIO|nr:hypothetical protein GCM10008961_03330 [Deinococcus knuensis]